MSHSTTVRLLDVIGKDFDSEVLQWKELIETELMQSFPLSNVSNF